jgi:hypothetical protein
MRSRKGVWAAGVLASLGTVSGCGASPPSASSATSTTATIRATTTVTHPVTGTQARQAPRASSAVASRPAKPRNAVPDFFKMPNLMGQNLQLGQDKLQARGSYLLDQQDAAGLSRIQVVDSNWTICTQRPAPGKRVPVGTVVVLASVKLSEQCP